MNLTFTSVRCALAGAIFLVFMAGVSFGESVLIDHEDAPGNGDSLSMPGVVEEIGLGLDFGGRFAAEVSLDALDLGFGDPVYNPANDPFIADRVVAILNTSGRAFTEAWYVAGASTSLSNWDGTITLAGGSALKTFKIDASGENAPLLWESLSADGIWQAGEVWEFVVQDFQNSEGIGPAAFNSLGLDNPAGSGSSASIVTTFQSQMIQSVMMKVEKGGIDGKRPVISFQGEEGVHYMIQSGLDLRNWDDLQPYLGNGSEISHEDARGFGDQSRYYRVIVDPAFGG